MADNITNLNKIHADKIASDLPRWVKLNPITDNTFAEIIHRPPSVERLLSGELKYNYTGNKVKAVDENELLEAQDIVSLPTKLLLESFITSYENFEKIMLELFSPTHTGEQKTIRLLIAYSIFIQSCYALDALDQTDYEIDEMLKEGDILSGGFMWVYLCHLARMSMSKSPHANIPRFVRQNVVEYFDISQPVWNEAVKITIEEMKTNLNKLQHFILDRSKDKDLMNIMIYFVPFIFSDGKKSTPVDIGRLNMSSMIELYDDINTGYY